MAENKNRTRRFLLRQPFMILGAVALLSLVQDLIQWQEALNTWLDAFQATTRPVWQFVFGPLEEAGRQLPFWLKDYLTAGVILTGLTARAVFAGAGSGKSWVLLLHFALTWPYWLAQFVFHIWKDADWKSVYSSVFWETGSWAFLILLTNFILLEGGGPSFYVPSY